MADLPVNSVELEDNIHTDKGDNYTLSGNTGCKMSVLITPSEKNQNLKTDLGCKNNQTHQGS